MAQLPDKENIRTLAIAGLCLALLAWNWRTLSQPEHSAMTMLALTAVFCGAVFYELTVRDTPMEWVLAGIVGVLALVAATWMILRVVAAPLANDHGLLRPARDSGVASGCPIPHGSMEIILGQTHVIANRAGAITPFRVGVCSGPNVTRMANGLVVNAFGYDGDGTVVYQIRNNLFTLIQGEYLHLHRADRSTLALYDKTESEVLYLRYLAPDTVRIRGRFTCADATPVTITDSGLGIPSGKIPLPPCIPLTGKDVPNLEPRTH